MVCETSASKSTSICLDYSRYLGDPRYQWCRCCTSQVPQTHKEWADAGRGIRSQQDPASADGVANRCPKQHKHDRRLLEVSWRASTHALCWWGHQSPVGANQVPPFFYGLQTLLLRPYIYIYMSLALKFFFPLDIGSCKASRAERRSILIRDSLFGWITHQLYFFS